jgi:hypothetical protein
MEQQSCLVNLLDVFFHGAMCRESATTKKKERETKEGRTLVAAVKAGAGWMLDNLFARLPSQKNSHNKKPQNSKQNSSLALRIEWLGGKKTEKEEKIGVNFREGV